VLGEIDGRIDDTLRKTGIGAGILRRIDVHLRASTVRTGTFKYIVLEHIDLRPYERRRRPIDRLLRSALCEPTDAVPVSMGSASRR